MSQSNLQSKTRIVSAPWVIAGRESIIQNGTVALYEGKINAVGTEVEVRALYPDAVVDSYPGVLMPPLVNAHMHLELSVFPGETPLEKSRTFTDWVEDLLARRFETEISENELYATIKREIQKQYNLGVVAIGDIGNQEISWLDARKSNDLPHIYRMIELLGSSGEAVAASLGRLNGFDTSLAVTAHAPYSTRAELLQAIKNRCGERGHVFSIHTAEVDEEKDFLLSQTGIFQEFLEKMGVWDGAFFEHGPLSKGTIDYFQKLNLLDDHTLLVHCVHVSDNDLQIIKDSGAHVCICPGSNAYLHSGIAPVGRMIHHGITPALGTDSRASNLTLNIWDEMQCLHQEHPDVGASEILTMATLGGAMALHLENDYGSLEKGKQASFIHVFSDKYHEIKTEEDLLHTLVSDGCPQTIEWV